MQLRTALTTAVVLLAILAVGIGCTRLVEEIPTPTPIPTPPESNRPKHTVTLGSIVQEIRGLGRIASSQEQELYFKQGGRLFNILVEQGQIIEKGQVLAELETGDLKHQIDQARISFDLAQLRLAKSRLEQATAEERAIETAVVQRVSAAAQLASAETAYGRALASLNKLTSEESSALAASRLSGIAAESSVKNAERELTRLKRLPTNEGLKAAEVAVEKSRTALMTARANVDSAEDALTQLLSIPTIEGLIGAEIEVERSFANLASAESGVGSAEHALTRLLSVPTSEDLIAAEVEVERSLASLAAAEAEVGAREKVLARLASQPDREQLIAAEVEVERSRAILASAEASVESAKNALARIAEKPTPEELKAAEIEAEKTRAAQWALQLNRDRACSGGSDSNACNSARAELAKGELSLAGVLDQLEKAKAGATQEEIAAATTALDLTRRSLSAAQAHQAQVEFSQEKVEAGATPGEMATASEALDVAIQSLLAVQAHHAKLEFSLAKVKSGATRDALAAATAAIDVAEKSLSAARAHHARVEFSLETIKAGATPGDLRAAATGLELANQSLSLATAQHEEAELFLEKVRAGAQAEEMAAAERALLLAIAQRDAAQAGLAQLAEFQGIDADVADKQVASARAALDAANVSYAQTADSVETNQASSLDLAIQEKQLELAQINLGQLENLLALAQLEAPFGGVVISRSGRDGDMIQPYKPVVAISNPEELVVAVDLSSSDLGKLELGQAAKIVVTSLPTDVFEGEIISIPSLGVVATAGQGPSSRTARISYTGPDTVGVGDLARVSIQVQKKEGVVVVPSRVIRSFAGRRFVRIVTASGRRQEVDVKIGINDDELTEIVFGLTEGQVVIEP